MKVTHRGVCVDFKRGHIIRNKDKMVFTFKYRTDGIELEPVAQSMLPAYVRPFIERHCLDFLN